MDHGIKGIEICVKYRALFRRSDATGLFLSWCPLLDIKSQGRTENEAKAALNDSVRLFVRNCYQRGILDEILLGLGLVPDPYVDDSADDGQDDSDGGQECVSVRPIGVAAPLDAWEPWIGEVPLHLIAAQKLAAAPAWPQ